MLLALHRIIVIALDYDGYRKVKDLKGLIDELRAIAEKAWPKSVSEIEYNRILTDYCVEAEKKRARKMRSEMLWPTDYTGRRAKKVQK
jgi:hypothetical protein